MARRFDLLIFDWDGTLMDSTACIAAALQAACEDLGYARPRERDALYVIGLGLKDALEHVLPGVPASEHPKVVERYRHHFLLRDRGTALYPRVPEMLDALRRAGHVLAIATGKSRRGLDRALQETGLAHVFHATRCADEGHAKPDPRMLHSLLDALAVAPPAALMIGDTTHDMAMARAAGVARVAVTHGAHERAALLEYQPLACVSDCGALHQWLEHNA